VGPIERFNAWRVAKREDRGAILADTVDDAAGQFPPSS
jgi:hypothetical protein